MWFTSMMFETSDLFFSENQSISVAIHIDAAFRTSRRVTAGEYGFDEYTHDTLSEYIHCYLIVFSS